MSKIQDQIKELQLKQKKLDYISYVSDLLKNDKHCVDFKDIKEEILSQIDPFLLNLMERIESGTVTEAAPAKIATTGLNSDETAVLKVLAVEAAKRMSGGTVPTQQRPAQPSSPYSSMDGTPPPPKKPITNTHDKMSFAMDNRHLGGKRVQVINDKNVDVRGVVVGLDAPLVIVKTDTGPTIEVPLEKIVPL